LTHCTKNAAIPRTARCTALPAVLNWAGTAQAAEPHCWLHGILSAYNTVFGCLRHRVAAELFHVETAWITAGPPHSVRNSADVFFVAGQAGLRKTFLMV